MNTVDRQKALAVFEYKEIFSKMRFAQALKSITKERKNNLAVTNFCKLRNYEYYF